MSRNPTRFRALAATALAAVIMLTAIPAGAALATDPAPAPAVAPTLDPAATSTPAPSPDPSPTPDPSGRVVAALYTDPAPAPNADPASIVTGAPATSAVPTTVSAASVVVAYARTHLRARYRRSATGPSAFDCSGLVWRVFAQAHLGRKVTSHSARGIYLAYRNRGLASRHNPQVGDLVVWGHGSHVGIYIGRGRAISALVGGVRVHRVNALTTPFTAYLHTRLAGVRLPVRLLHRTTRRAAAPRSGSAPLRRATVAVNLRAGHSTASVRLGTLAAGTRLRVLARAYDGSRRLWLRVGLGTGRTGWVFAAYTRR